MKDEFTPQDEDFNYDDEFEFLDEEDDIPPRKPKKKKKKKKKGKFGSNNTLNIILLLVIVLVLLVAVVKLLIWNKGIKLPKLDPNEDTSQFDTEALDSIVPLDATNVDVVRSNDDDELHILFLGNDAITHASDDKTGFVNLVQAKTGATVYNAGISGTYIASKNPTYDNAYPMDAFHFYNLVTYFTVGNKETVAWAKRDLKDGLPKDAEHAIEVLDSIDYSKLDVICIYYDATDYQNLVKTVVAENNNPVNTFRGAFEAGIKLLKENLPDTRIIVMSPTFAYFVGEDGKFVAHPEMPDDYTLDKYLMHELDICMVNNVSLVDNYYGTVHEDIVDKYLEKGSSILLNAAGREKAADRFVYDALNRFHDYDIPDKK